MSCTECGSALSGRQRKYCSQQCGKAAGRAAHLLRVYGLTQKDWDAIWQYQGERCGVCRRAPRPGEIFHLDHEHSVAGAGPCRGILCPYCNTRLVGRLKSATRAQQLADYLRIPPAPLALGREVWAPGRGRKKRSKRGVKRAA